MFVSKEILLVLIFKTNKTKDIKKLELKKIALSLVPTEFVFVFF